MDTDEPKDSVQKEAKTEEPAPKTGGWKRIGRADGQEPAVEGTAEDAQERARQKETSEPFEGQLLFGKYSMRGIEVSDQSLQNYVRFGKQPYPNIFGRRKYQAYYQSHINIVERLVNKLMRGGTGKKVGGKVVRTEGRLQGKKITVLHVVESAFEIINVKSGKNPVQVLVEALQNAAPIEDTTRVRYGGISYNVAVGISSNRRVDVALRNIALAALVGAFKSKKRLAESLADELMLAANKSPESYAIKKRIEGERIARRSR